MKMVRIRIKRGNEEGRIDFFVLRFVFFILELYGNVKFNKL